MKIRWQIDIAYQERYFEVMKRNVKSGFYWDAKMYVLPFLPEKFRDRVVFMPEESRIRKLWNMNKNMVDKMRRDWEREWPIFFRKIKKYFYDVDHVNIVLTPVVFGSLGYYEIKDKSIYLFPRRDRKTNDVQRLLVLALTHYFYFDRQAEMLNFDIEWMEKQNKSKEYQELIVGKNSSKSLVDILDREFAGDLAEISRTYMRELGFKKKQNELDESKLTHKEKLLFGILVRNSGKVVNFSNLIDEIWGDEEMDISLFALTKLIERLKAKLPNGSIHVQRGKGYLYWG